MVPSTEGEREEALWTHRLRVLALSTLIISMFWAGSITRYQGGEIELAATIISVGIGTLLPTVFLMVRWKSDPEKLFQMYECRKRRQQLKADAQHYLMEVRARNRQEAERKR